MYKSIEQELHELRDRLGVSPVAGVFAGLHHIRYKVAIGTAWPLMAEVSKKTQYQFSEAFRRLADNTHHFFLRLEGSSIIMIIEETMQPLEGFPRLSALGFQVDALEPVKEVLKEEKVSFHELSYGLETEPITGLGDRFYFMQRGDLSWYRGPDFVPIKPDAHTLASLPERSLELEDVGPIDHIAYRIQLEGVRRAATLLMRLTAYQFDSCYTVGDQNAETMVFRWGTHKPAMVASYGWDESSVVHKYVTKYGPRVHHLAYYTDSVRSVVAFQKRRNVGFTTEEMIGDPSRGILQIFSTPSPYSHEITEYVERFGDFTGFFDRGNVNELMDSTRMFN